MFKVLLVLTSTLLMASVHARSCKVGGISDSPQAISCKFNQSTINLKCENGQYYLNDSQVTVAYHMEVEDGPVPLIFETPDMTLAVLIESDTDVKAELESASSSRQGKCTLK